MVETEVVSAWAMKVVDVISTTYDAFSLTDRFKPLGYLQ